jgi:hypothetical protein
MSRAAIPKPAASTRRNLAYPSTFENIEIAGVDGARGRHCQSRRSKALIARAARALRGRRVGQNAGG